MTLEVLPLSRVILAMLAEGRPVEPSRIAEAVGEAVKAVERALVFDLPAQLDKEGRVTALSLSLDPTPHRVTLDGRTLYSWCVGQALMYPTWLGRDVRLESPCRETGQPVVVDFTTERVQAVDPEGAVIGSHALAAPSPRLQQCDDMRLFSTSEAAGRWHDRHPEAVVLPVREAYERYLPLLRTLV